MNSRSSQLPKAEGEGRGRKPFCGTKKCQALGFHFGVLVVQDKSCIDFDLPLIVLPLSSSRILRNRAKAFT